MMRSTEIGRGILKRRHGQKKESNKHTMYTSEISGVMEVRGVSVD